MQCSCINGSSFSCAQPFDDGQHGHKPGGIGYIPHDGSCDDDVFFGGIWHQRLKQVALSNGIAVLDVNNFVRDGWESWGTIWDRGYDPPFFAALPRLLGGADSPPLFRKLNRNLLAFRGWSGGVSVQPHVFLCLSLRFYGIEFVFFSAFCSLTKLVAIAGE